MGRKDPTQNAAQLGNLLLRYKKHFKAPQGSVLAEVVVVVKEVLGVTVSVRQFSYSVPTRVVYVKTPSIIKIEIIKNKKQILKTLRERLGEQSCPVDFI